MLSARTNGWTAHRLVFQRGISFYLYPVCSWLIFHTPSSTTPPSHHPLTRRYWITRNQMRILSRGVGVGDRGDSTPVLHMSTTQPRISALEGISTRSCTLENIFTRFFTLGAAVAALVADRECDIIHYYIKKSGTRETSPIWAHLKICRLLTYLLTYLCDENPKETKERGESTEMKICTP